MIKLRYQHQSTSLQTRRTWEDIAADSAFQLGLLMSSDTASFLRPFGYGITCLQLSSCLLPSRCSSPDWQVSIDVEDRLDPSCFYQHFCTFLSVLLLEFNSCFHHFLHICHVQHYSQEDLSIMEKRRRRRRESGRGKQMDWYAHTHIVIRRCSDSQNLQLA